MNALLRPAAALAALCATLPLAAQTAQTAENARQLPPEPNVQHLVIEDEGVRVEELRVRGQTQRLVVRPRNAAPYEVIPGGGERDMSSGPGNSRGAAGQRVWNMLSF
ncbi:hypothetical protein [Azohydromonas caseinilytica]|uniref:DUF2782 domain-containing protein n=1 Tax=Azohydromonas caseinilytica TaxID=2728836 RepID=A0A848F1N6_9BURK|nr:hypothetical protein [Azohydromonas caseinilytica]NML13987.1 hypothetical protein [Azohydromonas caseinilytica]